MEGGYRQIWPVARVSILASIVVLPVFLTGALGFEMRSDLSVSVAGMGVAISLFFLVTSVGSPLTGRVVQRRGAAWGLTLAGSISSAALVALSFARSPWMLIVALSLAGVANAVLHPAAALALSTAVVDRHQALAFGVKQSSVPLATMGAGLAVPLVALLVGWRFAVAVAAALGLAGGIVLPPRHAIETGAARVSLAGGHGSRPVAVRRLVLLSVGGGFGAFAGTGVGTFFVEAAIDSGQSEVVSGLLFAAGSGLAIFSRVAIGWAADAYPPLKRYSTAVMMLLIGAIGFWILSLGEVSGYVAGAILALGIGWGWTGLFNYLCVADNRSAAAVATGIVTSGLALGAGLGPLVFGIVADAASFDVGWIVMAAAGLVAAILITVAARYA